MKNYTELGLDKAALDEKRAVLDHERMALNQEVTLDQKCKDDTEPGKGCNRSQKKRGDADESKECIISSNCNKTITKK